MVSEVGHVFLILVVRVVTTVGHWVVILAMDASVVVWAVIEVL